MRTSIKFFLGLLVVALLLTSCSKANHSIRIKNSYSSAFSNVSVGGTSYGSISVGGTTSYKPIDEGNFSLSGTTVGGQPLTGSGSVSGKGTHKWTLTITSGGSVSFAEDK